MGQRPQISRFFAGLSHGSVTGRFLSLYENSLSPEQQSLGRSARAWQERTRLGKPRRAGPCTTHDQPLGLQRYENAASISANGAAGRVANRTFLQ